MRKMAAFVAYHRQGAHASRYGITNFRVITVTPTKQRALNLCRKLQEAGIDSGRFWFTDMSHVLLERPGEIVDNIFLTPKDYAEGLLHSFRT